MFPHFQLSMPVVKFSILPLLYDYCSGADDSSSLGREVCLLMQAVKNLCRHACLLPRRRLSVCVITAAPPFDSNFEGKLKTSSFSLPFLCKIGPRGRDFWFQVLFIPNRDCRPPFTLNEGPLDFQGATLDP